MLPQAADNAVAGHMRPVREPHWDYAVVALVKNIPLDSKKRQETCQEMLVAKA